MNVTELWRFPVKSMQGERLEQAPVTERGIEGDRAWCLFDLEANVALTARRVPEMLYAAARVVDGEVVVTLPDGTETVESAALSTWFGKEVELRRADTMMAGTFETQADETETGQWFQWTGPEGSFHDSTKSRVSLVTAETFRDWDRRRFRINVILDGRGDVELVGHKIQVGSVELEVLKRIDRCVMTTRPQPALGDQPPVERDLDVLRTINRENDTFLGIGGNVISGGAITLGDVIKTVD